MNGQQRRCIRRHDFPEDQVNGEAVTQRDALCCLLSVLMLTLSATSSAALSEPYGYVPPMTTDGQSPWPTQTFQRPDRAAVTRAAAAAAP
jgi:hypothetical protein